MSMIKVVTYVSEVTKVHSRLPHDPLGPGGVTRAGPRRSTPNFIESKNFSNKICQVYLVDDINPHFEQVDISEVPGELRIFNCNSSKVYSGPPLPAPK